MPNGARFVRFAPPDGGVECLWRLPDGSEYGWQAKYFPLSLQNTQWRQIERSVTRALQQYPRLKKYVVCLPINRTPSSEKKWDEYVSRWKQIRNIDFEYWGESEIEFRLSHVQYGGLYKYFFEKEFLTNDWFDRRRQIAIKDAGPRYSQELNVNLPIAQLFDILGRTDKFYNMMNLISQKIRVDWKYAASPEVVLLADSEFGELQHKIEYIVVCARNDKRTRSGHDKF